MVESEGEKLLVEGDLVVGADGANSKVRLNFCERIVCCCHGFV